MFLSLLGSAPVLSVCGVLLNLLGSAVLLSLRAMLLGLLDSAVLFSLRTVLLSLRVHVLWHMFHRRAGGTRHDGLQHVPDVLLYGVKPSGTGNPAE